MRLDIFARGAQHGSMPDQTTRPKRRHRARDAAWDPNDILPPGARAPKPRAAKSKPPAGPLTFAQWAKDQNLGSEQLATMFGIHRATVLELLAGRRWPSARTALQIMETSGGQVCFWDVSVLAENIRVRVRPPEPRPAAGKRR